MKLIHRTVWAAIGGCLFLSINLLLPLLTPAQTPATDLQFQQLVEADQLYLAGRKEEAERLYREAKSPFPEEDNTYIPEPITDPEQLSGAGRVWWREAKQGWDQDPKLESKILIPLNLLVDRQPEFVPGHLLLYEALQEFGEEEEAIPTLEKAVSLFPNSAELNKALINALEADSQWLEASITARQFALINPDHPESAEFSQIADEDFRRFRRRLKDDILTSGILGGVAGLVRGDGMSQAVALAPMMLQGESKMGSQLAAARAQDYDQKGKLIKDPDVVGYINEIGQKLAGLMGRDEFDYEFYVIQEDSINAVALPGGKVFVNTGAILSTKTEAELAGLLGHEVSHAVLSHGFQRITKSNLLANIGRMIPFGNLASTLITLEYSRKNERQSDILGTRVLVLSGYAADGLRNFFVTLNQSKGGSSPPAYLSSHPATSSRIRYLEEMIQQNGYNRYAYEGVAALKNVQNRLQGLPPVEAESTFATTESLLEAEPTTDPAVEEPPQEQVTDINEPVVGEVAMAASRTQDEVTIKLDGANVSKSGNYTVNLVIENQSDRPFGFVPVFAKVVDASGESITSKLDLEIAGDALIQPGQQIRGELSIFGQPWSSANSQDLMLVITEGTSGGRLFRIPF